MYFDGHDRDGVVALRKQFLLRLADLDESTFYANAMESSFRADNEGQVLRQKSLGAAITVSDFIEEVGGYLRHEGEEASVH